ncbi:MAG: hypothetical protein LBS96_04835 [Oscillospiraceae bacterium]|jgi:hypothetical protein|nr:hypothetical protein [Oscillospiraceae bacterium]
MKHTAMRILATLLAAGLLFSLASCSLFDEVVVETLPAALEPLPEGSVATLAYYNERLLPLLTGAEGYNLTVSYSIGAVEAENETFRAVVPALKKLLTKGLGKEEKEQPVDATAYPLLRNALLAEDVAEIKAVSVLELQLEAALPGVKEEYAHGYIEKETFKQTLTDYAMDHKGLKKGKELDAWLAETLQDTDEALRLYTIQTKVSDVDAAAQEYQLDITLQPGLSPEAAERYIQPEDKAAILAELAKAAAYMQVTDYEKIPQVADADAEQPQTYTLTCKVDNTTNHLVELTLVARYEIAADIRGTGTLAGEGSFTATAPLEKAVKITFNWPEPEKEK